jgi:hypothetical protein
MGAGDLEAIDHKGFHLEEINLEEVNLKAGDREVCAMEAETVLIG